MRSRRQTRRLRRRRQRDSFVSAKANFKKGTGRRSSFSAFLPFIEIAATSFHRRSVPFRSVLVVETRRINEEAAFVYLTQFERDAFSSSCAMNQDFLEYFPEYQIPAPLSYTGWSELPRVGFPSTEFFFRRVRRTDRTNRYLANIARTRAKSSCTKSD